MHRLGGKGPEQQILAQYRKGGFHTSGILPKGQNQATLFPVSPAITKFHCPEL